MFVVFTVASRNAVIREDSAAAALSAHDAKRLSRFFAVNFLATYANLQPNFRQNV